MPGLPDSSLEGAVELIYPSTMIAETLVSCLSGVEKYHVAAKNLKFSFPELSTDVHQNVRHFSEAYLAMNSWTDNTPFRERFCIEKIISLDVSNRNSKIGSPLQVCLPFSTFEHLKEKVKSSRIRSELIPQLLHSYIFRLTFSSAFVV